MFYKDCLKCRLKNCPEECYDQHRGSSIALKKIFPEMKNEDTPQAPPDATILSKAFL